MNDLDLDARIDVVSNDIDKYFSPISQNTEITSYLSLSAFPWTPLDLYELSKSVCELLFYETPSTLLLTDAHTRDLKS